MPALTSLQVTAEQQTMIIDAVGSQENLDALITETVVAAVISKRRAVKEAEVEADIASFRDKIKPPKKGGK